MNVAATSAPCSATQPRFGKDHKCNGRTDGRTDG